MQQQLLKKRLEMKHIEDQLVAMDLLDNLQKDRVSKDDPNVVSNESGDNKVRKQSQS